MTKRSLSRAEMVGLIRIEPARRSVWSVIADVHRKNTTFRFLSEFAGFSLVVLVATGSIATIRNIPTGSRPESSHQASTPVTPPFALPRDPREAGLSGVTEAIAPNPAAAPTPSLYRLGPDAVAGVPSNIEGQIYFAVELLRRHASAQVILTVIKDLDTAEPNTALVRGLAMIALGGRDHAVAGIADLKRAAEAGQVAAEAFYGLALLDPPALLERHPTEGRRWLQKAVDAGDHGAQYVLGNAYLSGWAGLTDLAAAATLIKAAADAGDVEAMKLLAGLYLNGKGVPKDVDACEHYLRKAMETGDTDAQGLYGAYLVTMSVAGWGGPSLDEAASWLRKAAEAGNPHAMHMLGIVQVEYAKTPPLRDLRAGVDWFERCAALKDSECEFALGHAYAEGLGRAKNLVLAARNFKEAAQSGSSRGLDELAKVNAELAKLGLSEEAAAPAGGGSMTAMAPDPRIPTFADTVGRLNLK